MAKSESSFISPAPRVHSCFRGQRSMNRIAAIFGRKGSDIASLFERTCESRDGCARAGRMLDEIQRRLGSVTAVALEAQTGPAIRCETPSECLVAWQALR